MKIKISPQIASDFLNKYRLWILGIIFFLLLCLDGFLYYQYVYSVMNIKPEITGRQLTIDQETFDKVKGIIEAREENLLKVKKTQYYNPFND